MPNGQCVWREYLCYIISFLRSANGLLTHYEPYLFIFAVHERHMTLAVSLAAVRFAWPGGPVLPPQEGNTTVLGQDLADLNRTGHKVLSS